MVKGWGKCSAPRLLPRTQSCWAPAGLRGLLTAMSFIHSTNMYRGSALCWVPWWMPSSELSTADTALSPGVPVLVRETDTRKRVKTFSSGKGLEEAMGGGGLSKEE